LATLLADARIQDQALEPVREKVLAGQRLSFADGVALYRSHDLLAIGALANHVREQRHGNGAYFVWNTHINHTNVCVATCDFCAFAATKDEPRTICQLLPKGATGPSYTSRDSVGMNRLPSRNSPSLVV
jgi:aminodeoxyfutalosine synthase